MDQIDSYVVYHLPYWMKSTKFRAEGRAFHDWLPTGSRYSCYEPIDCRIMETKSQATTNIANSTSYAIASVLKTHPEQQRSEFSKIV